MAQLGIVPSAGPTTAGPAAARYAQWACLFVILGLALAVLGPSLPPLRGTFGISLSQSGLVFALHSTGYFIGVLAAGPLADARGRRLVVGLGAAALGAGMLLAAAAPAWALVLAAMVLAGIGFACVDVGLNAAMGDSVSTVGRRALLMNLMHGAFPIGTLLGPLALSAALRAGLGWRTAFATTGVAAALSAAALAVPGRAWPHAPPEAHSPSLWHLLRLLREPQLRALALCQGLYVGVEVSLGGWITTYLLGRYGAGEADAALAGAVYWLGFLLGRPIAAAVTHRVAPVRVLPWMIAGGLAGGLLGVLAPSAPLAAAAYAATGFAICGIFPTVMALALHDRPGDAGAVSGLVMAAASLGSLVWPWLVGAVAQVAGLPAAMATAAAPLALMLAAARAVRRAPAGRPAPAGQPA